MPLNAAFAAVVPLPEGNDESPPNLIQPMFSLHAYPVSVPSAFAVTPQLPAAPPQPFVSVVQLNDIHPMVSDHA
jgi:hypothetical protein